MRILGRWIGSGPAGCRHRRGRPGAGRTRRLRVAGAGAQGQFELAGFESPASLAPWQPRDLTHLTRTDAWSSTGRWSAAVTFEAWQAGREQWPAVILAPLPQSDFTPYDALAFELHNPQDRPVTVKLHLNDGEARAQRLFTLPPRSTLAVQQRLDELGDRLDLTRVHCTSTGRGRLDFTVYTERARVARQILRWQR